MCKYCKLRETKIPGELTNDYRSIGSIRDGITYFSLIMNRYKCTSHVNELVLEQSICINGTDYVVKTKEIPIKYCPFCGEEL